MRRVMLLIALWFASCSPNGPGDEPGKSEFSAIESAVVDFVNEYRLKMEPHRNALSSNDDIAREARKHSEDMAAGKMPVGHDGFSDRVAAIKTRILVKDAGENVAAMNPNHEDIARAAVEAWLSSSSHKTNVEADWSHTGVGVAKASSGYYYLTQIFVLIR